MQLKRVMTSFFNWKWIDFSIFSIRKEILINVVCIWLHKTEISPFKISVQVFVSYEEYSIINLAFMLQKEAFSFRRLDIEPKFFIFFRSFTLPLAKTERVSQDQHLNWSPTFELKGSSNYLNNKKIFTIVYVLPGKRPIFCQSIWFPCFVRKQAGLSTSACL